MTSKSKQEAQNPLILRCHRLIEAFGKSNDERDFYLDRVEGFLIYCNLDKSEEELAALDTELKSNSQRYCLVPKLTFYETKKIMEGFVNEKVYDIDTKEKLLDIIQSKEARENFLEFIYDHHAEFEKWQQFYHERSRIRIIEWLRSNHFHFVFEEDLDLPTSTIEKLKTNFFETKVGKEIIASRKVLTSKAKTYYSNEALNPRPKRGRPPKQAIKQEIEPQFARDIYLTVQSSLRPFLFSPETNNSSAVNFSAKFDGEDELLPQRRHPTFEGEVAPTNVSSSLLALREISAKWVDPEKSSSSKDKKKGKLIDFNLDDDDDSLPSASKTKKKAPAKVTKKAAKVPVKVKAKAAPTKFTKLTPKVPKKKVAVKAAPAKKVAVKDTPPKKGALRSILKSKTANKKKKK
ncbi:MAG: UPF0158 family protein [Parachlamydiaceae bacterium]|nr:UPF0158 family protein [Parachlamydiaceae bacterium]